MQKREYSDLQSRNQQLQNSLSRADMETRFVSIVLCFWQISNGRRPRSSLRRLGRRRSGYETRRLVFALRRTCGRWVNAQVSLTFSR